MFGPIKTVSLFCSVTFVAPAPAWWLSARWLSLVNHHFQGWLSTSLPTTLNSGEQNHSIPKAGSSNLTSLTSFDTVFSEFLSFFSATGFGTSWRWLGPSQGQCLMRPFCLVFLEKSWPSQASASATKTKRPGLIMVRPEIFPIVSILIPILPGCLSTSNIFLWIISISWVWVVSGYLSFVFISYEPQPGEM